MISTVFDPEVMALRERETEIAGEHTLGCYEWFVELLIEQAEAEGVALEGNPDDEYRGLRVCETFWQQAAGGTLKCHCPVEADEEE